jgi:hypothetical protein
MFYLQILYLIELKEGISVLGTAKVIIISSLPIQATTHSFC